MIDKIISNVMALENRVAYLKSISKYYPEIVHHQEGYRRFYTTLVRILRNGKWYNVHLVKDAVGNDSTYLSTLKSMAYEAHLIQYLYKLCGHEDIDQLQESEEDRLKKLIGI